MNNPITEKLFRTDRLPHIWCPGCGHGIILGALARTIEKLGYEKDDVCIVSGIGCSSRAPGYLDFNTLHTTHGRALAFATGVKLANPNLKVIVISGDGDASAIGGNHLIHASRRNIDITTLVFNNNIYGMTGGQYSPTTPTNEFGTTAPHGNIDKPFDIAHLAASAGATYAGRTTAFHVTQMEKMMEKALEHKGFSLLEAISTCPTYYGRKNKKGSAANMIKYLKDNFIDVKVAEKLPAEKVAGKHLMGEFKCVEEPEYTAQYQKIIDRLAEDK